MDDTRVHDALERLAADAPARSDAVWERTQQRIARRRRTRVLVTGALVVVLLLGVAGVVAAVRSHNDDNRIAAGPSDVPRTPDHVLAVVNGRFEVRPVANGVEQDGNQVSHVADAFDVAAVPGASHFVYTKEPTPTRSVMPVGGPLVRVRATDGAQTLVTDAAAVAPTISPDGRLLAFRVTDGYGKIQIAVRDLATLQAAAIVDPSSSHYLSDLTDAGAQMAEPLAWTPDSRRLLINDGTGAYVLLGVGVNAPPRLLTTMPDGVTHAVYIDDDKIAIAYRQAGADADTLAVYYVGSGALRPIAANDTISNPTVSRLSFDPTSGTVLATTLDSSGLTGRLVTFTPSESHEGSKISGLTSASWFSPPSNSSTTTARAASVTVPNVLGLDVASARSALVSVGFRVTSNGSSGPVVVQQPAAGAVADRGSTVTITVCPKNARCPFSIPPLESRLGGAIAVPNLRGTDVVAARAALQQLGLNNAEVIEHLDGAMPTNTPVFWQDPPAGTLRVAGETVWLWACADPGKCESPPPARFVNALPNALGWKPVATNDSPWTTFAAREFDTPEALASAIVADIKHAPEAPKTVTYTITDRGPNTAHMWVQTRNMPDDSIDGVDYEFSVMRADGKWTLHKGRVRTICVRGVASADSCL